MEESSVGLKHKRRWQFGIYTISSLFLARDLFSEHYGYGFTYITGLFDVCKPYFLLLALPLLSISLFLAVRSPRLGARTAIAATSISFVFYLSMWIINLVAGPYFYVEVIRFYLPPIFLLGATFIYSHKILQSSTEQIELLIPMLFFKLRWTPKMQKYVISAFILVFGILGIQWFYPRASCAAIGGRWVYDGIFGQAQYCLHGYPDAGKACQSSEDCMGRCLAETNSSDVVTVIPTAGVCAPSNQVFGCFYIFENQEISGYCID
jgi:hypothetical protein